MFITILVLSLFYKTKQINFTRPPLVQNSQRFYLKISNVNTLLRKTTLISSLENKKQIKLYKTSDYIFFPVNKTISLDDFYPDDLVILDQKYSIGTVRVSSLIINDLKKMIDDAGKLGIEIKVISGFRSYIEQEILFNSYVLEEKRKNPNFTENELIGIVNRYSAKPGHSEHQLGTTVDLASSENGYKLVADEKSKYQKWLLKNAHKYNFRISYPKGNKEYIYEPWHLRWWPNQNLL